MAVWTWLGPGHWAMWGTTAAAPDAFVFEHFDVHHQQRRFNVEICTIRGAYGLQFNTLAQAQLAAEAV